MVTDSVRKQREINASALLTFSCAIVSPQPLKCCHLHSWYAVSSFQPLGKRQVLSEAGVSADSKFHKAGRHQIKKKREKDGREGRDVSSLDSGQNPW